MYASLYQALKSIIVVLLITQIFRDHIRSYFKNHSIINTSINYSVALFYILPLCFIYSTFLFRGFYFLSPLPSLSPSSFNQLENSIIFKSHLEIFFLLINDFSIYHSIACNKYISFFKQFTVSYRWIYIFKHLKSVNVCRSYKICLVFWRQEFEKKGLRREQTSLERENVHRNEITVPLLSVTN